MDRITALLLGSAALFGVGALVPSPALAQGADADLVKRGEYLVTAGDCAACHTVPGGKPFAGGHALNTPCLL